MECRPPDTLDTGVVQRVEPLAGVAVRVALPAHVPDIGAVVTRPDRSFLTVEPVRGVEPGAGIEHDHLVVGGQSVGNQRARGAGADDADIRVRDGSSIGVFRAHRGPRW